MSMKIGDYERLVISPMRPHPTAKMASWLLEVILRTQGEKREKSTPRQPDSTVNDTCG